VIRNAILRFRQPKKGVLRLAGRKNKGQHLYTLCRRQNDLHFQIRVTYILKQHRPFEICNKHSVCALLETDFWILFK
jgi:hypothetical protein